MKHKYDKNQKQSFDDCSEALAKHLKELAEENGRGFYSLIAQKAGVSPSSICHYAKNLILPSVTVLAIIAKETGVSVDWMLGLSDARYRTNMQYVKDNVSKRIIKLFEEDLKDDI